MELTIGDRATLKAAGKVVPVADIAVHASKKWIKENLRLVDPEKHLKYRVILSTGSEELTDIFFRDPEKCGLPMTPPLRWDTTP